MFVLYQGTFQFASLRHGRLSIYEALMHLLVLKPAGYCKSALQSRLSVLYKNIIPQSYTCCGIKLYLVVISG